MGMEAFWVEFEQLIKFPMVVYNREPTVERTIDFIAKFVVSLSRRAADGDNEVRDEEVNPVLLRLFDFLLQVCTAKMLLFYFQSSIINYDIPKRRVFKTTTWVCTALKKTSAYVRECLCV
jgi:hypothetical protein